MLWFVIIFLIANQRQWHFAPYIVAITLILTAITLSGISPVHFWRRMRILVILALLGALPAVFCPDSHVNVLHTFEPLLITYAQIRWLIFIYSSLVAILIFLLLLPIPPLRNFGQYRRLRRISIRERLQSLASLFLPFIHGTLRRAADLATALEARDYEVEGHQTLLHEKSFAAADYIVLGTVAFVTIGALNL